MSLVEESTTLRIDESAEQDGWRGPLCLRILHSPDPRREELPIDEHQTLTIGRDVDNGLKIHDPRLSRAHLRIVWDAQVGAFRFADLDSSNGTRVNGEDRRGGVLSENDVIRIGDTLLHVSSSAARGGSELSERACGSGLPLLILGETGSGKEVFAREVHEKSRRSGAFVAVNVATLRPELAAAELFGHLRGAFSGALHARPGLFRAAEGGTLFLDEIGDLPGDAQPALLRALEARAIRPIGSDAELPVDVRVVAATNVDLEAATASGRFREDLLARLAHLVVRVQPLRKRRNEILKLAQAFVPHLNLTPTAAEALVLWDWPRNVRELRALVESLAVLFPEGHSIRAQDIADRVPSATTLAERKSALPAPAPSTDRREVLVRALEKHGGNVAAVARELGKPRSHVYRWVKNLGLSSERFRRQ